MVTGLARARRTVKQDVVGLDVAVEHVHVVELLQSERDVLNDRVLHHVEHAGLLVFPLVVILEERLERRPAPLRHDAVRLRVGVLQDAVAGHHMRVVQLDEKLELSLVVNLRV